MTDRIPIWGAVEHRSPTDNEKRYCAWFHELDAWTEYWEIYHPESRGRFYFGDGSGEPGFLTQFVPVSVNLPRLPHGSAWPCRLTATWLHLFEKSKFHK
jgi:hypothetical protein